MHPQNMNLHASTPVNQITLDIGKKMRNLSEFPITHGDAASALQEAHLIHLRLGREGMDASGRISMLLVEQFIRQNKDAFDKFSKEEINNIWKNDA